MKKKGPYNQTADWHALPGRHGQAGGGQARHSKLVGPHGVPDTRLEVQGLVAPARSIWTGLSRPAARGRAHR